MVEREAAHPLGGRTVYIPRMPYGGARAFASALRSVGIEAAPSPPSDARTLELGAQWTSGDECLPERVTLGNFLKVAEAPDFDPRRVAFFMPTAGGPCRFGQYRELLRWTLRQRGLEDVPVISPSSANGYEGVGDQAGELMRTAWRALVGADILQKLLHRVRPYARQADEAERAFQESLDDYCAVIEIPGLAHKERLPHLVASLKRARERFHSVAASYTRDRLLIGVVGEIFCRLNEFSNENTVRRVEELGGECWLSDIAEWVWYTNAEQVKNLELQGKGWSKERFGAWFKTRIQRGDEHALYAPFKEDFRGYEEPQDIKKEVLERSWPYLPYTGALGEMVLSVGKAIYLYDKGADGIIDISPFSCMNGITCEAVYPDVSRDHDGIPIRVFYFDGTAGDLSTDLDIFLELARSYSARKRRPRVYPARFEEPGVAEETRAGGAAATS